LPAASISIATFIHNIIPQNTRRQCSIDHNSKCYRALSEYAGFIVGEDPTTAHGSPLSSMATTELWMKHRGMTANHAFEFIA
jgi:hypothetical protein